MIQPTDAQVAALALPGDDWATARRRAHRLLSAVRVCRPCPLCASGGELDNGLRGWIDDERDSCVYCAGYRDTLEQW
ncbi:hypothetical protein DZC31_30010 (plasmid) [Stenotrophomonas rhizophila]|nr:hypothetical protein DZC31_30010 [Stenotrophomonas rhizophila]